MSSGISINGVPMVWVIVDENPRTGDLEMYPSKDANSGDWLIPAEKVNYGPIPISYLRDNDPVRLEHNLERKWQAEKADYEYGDF
tara:strand:- start:193 stop:447 length:255 start_codon:yes stop_codon:yes gene_type:complete